MDNILFIIRKNDWRNQIKYIKESDFDESTMKLVEVDKEELRKISEVFSRDDSRIKVHMNGDVKTSFSFVKREEFNPLTMTVVYTTQEEYDKKQEELKKAWKDGTISVNITSFTRDRKPGIGFKDKVDEGAMEDLLDRGFEDAKKRATAREKKTGYGFKRSKRISKKKVQKLINEGKLGGKSNYKRRIY